MSAPSILAECLDHVGAVCQALVTSAQGMLVTAKYLVTPAEIVTFRYPLVKRPVARNYRGRLVNETPRCISCELCAKVCPPQCIAIEHEIGADKKRILKRFDIDMTICLYCGLCTEICPDTTRDAVTNEKCLTMMGGYEYSSDRKESIGFYFTATDEHLALQRKAAEERAEKAKQEAAAKAAAAAAAKAAAAKEAADKAVATGAESGPAVTAKATPASTSTAPTTAQPPASKPENPA